MSEVQIMIDLEGLATTPDGCMLSMGAVKFDFEGNILGEFYQNVDPASCKALGFYMDPVTVKWWKEQSPEALAAFKDDPVSIGTAMERLNQWVGYDTNASWWCKGGAYDFAMIALYCKALGIKPPYKYWNCNDCRTIFNLVKMDMKEGREGTAHDALDDAKWQVKKLLEALV